MRLIAPLRSFPTTLAVVALSAPALANDLEFTNLQGGLSHGVYFRSDGLTGWAVEDGGRIRKTTDGFDTWTFQETPASARVQLRGVYFVEGGTFDGWGCAVGDQHTILRTDNGGATWTQVDKAVLPDWPDDPEDLNLWDVVFVEVAGPKGPELHGWVAGREGVLWYSTDAGASWESQHDNYNEILWHGYNRDDRYGLHAVEDGTGTLHVYVTGDWGVIAHTTDEGATWDFLDNVPGMIAPDFGPNIEIYDVEVLPTGDGYATGGVGTACGRAYRISNWTTVTWEQLGPQNPAPEPPPASCTSGHFTSATTLYGMGILPDGRGVGGGYASHTWRAPFTGSLWESTYQPLPSADPVTPPLWGTTSVGTRVYTVGQFGILRRTDDGTAAAPVWVDKHGTETTRLIDGDFIDGSTGWVTGQTGRVHKTTDGGLTFTEVFNPSLMSFYNHGLDFADANRGIVVGNPVGTVPFIAYTHQGGDDQSEWTQVGSGALPDFGGSPPFLFDVHFFDANLAWAVGSNGWVLHSDDGGVTWDDADPNGDLGTLKMNAVSFLTPTIGVVVGTGGRCFATLGNDLWFELDVNLTGGADYTGELLGVEARLPSTVVAVGEDGYVFAYVAATGTLEQVYQSTTGFNLESVALHPTQLQVYAGAADGGFVWYDGSGWSEPNSEMSYRMSAIAPVGDGGFAIGQSFLLNRFDLVP